MTVSGSPPTLPRVDAARLSLAGSSVGAKDIERLTKQAIIDYNIDVPIQATRIVGNKLELYLYGGQVIRVPIAGDVGADMSPVLGDRDPPTPPAKPPANNNGGRGGLQPALKAKIKRSLNR